MSDRTNESGINGTPDQVQTPHTDDWALRKQIKDLEEQNRYLLEQLTAAYHTISTVLEIETQMNKHEKSWIHSDRRAVAELIVKICRERLDSTPRPLTKEAIATHLDDNF